MFLILFLLLQDLLQYRGPTLHTHCDFDRVATALEDLGAANNSFRFYTRTSEAYRPTYELIRRGRMPESKSLLGKVLNQVIGGEELGAYRTQQINGARMPPFEQIRKYLGPAGLFTRTESDGWLICGCLLPADDVDGAADPR